jgi:peptidoglycan/xylan/chitin deacetylase (PgdA/CDA1 family)
MSRKLRASARRIAAYLLYYSGILLLLARVRLRDRAVILMYHRVLPAQADTCSDPSIIVSPDRFAWHMAALRRFLRPLSPRELAEHLYARKAPPSRSCVVTFDDGWQDNFTHALPALREESIPAMVFVATDYAGSASCFWQERVTRLLCAAATAPGTARALAEVHLGEIPPDATPPELKRIARRAVNQMKNLAPPEIERIESELRASLANPVTAYADDRFMTWEEIVELQRDSRVTIGAHGCSHTPLTKLAPDRASAELEQSRARLESVVGAPIDAIAYPNGNHDDQVIGLTRAAGFRLGFTTEKGIVDAGADPLRLPRLNIDDSVAPSLPEFLCAILMVFRRPRRAARAT